MSNNEQKEYMEVDGVKISRKRTIVETESQKRKEVAHEYVSHLPPTAELPAVEKYMPGLLSGAIFCGHLVTDMDSIAGAIGAAELYGGTPARASEVNSETKFCLEHWGVAAPVPIEELLVTMPKAGVCLVDHQQTSQLNKAIQVRILSPHVLFVLFACNGPLNPLFAHILLFSLSIMIRWSALWA